jgi:hypothetical protein
MCIKLVIKHELIIMTTITNVSTDDLFDGTFQQKILVVDKNDFQNKNKIRKLMNRILNK